MPGKPSPGSVRVEVTRQPAGRADTDFVAVYDQNGKLRVKAGNRLTVPQLDAMNWLVQGVIGSARG